MWNAPAFNFTPTKRQVPTKLADDCYAVIKLSKFDNLEVAIMADVEANGGIAISYEDAHLDPATKAKVEAEIQSIISNEMNKVMGE